MNHDLTGRIGQGTLFGGSAGNQRRAIHQRPQAVIGASKKAFWKNDQRAPGLDEDINGQFDRGAVSTFAINAIEAKTWQKERLNGVLLKYMPARHVIKPMANFAGERTHDQAVFVPAMIGHEQDAVTGTQ